MKKLLYFGIIILNLILITNLHSSEHWSSTFDSDSEDWQVYLGPDLGFRDPVYNDGGYICFSRNDNYGWFLTKLNWFDWSEFYGGTIVFDIKLSGDGDYNDAVPTAIIDLPGEVGTYFYADIPLMPPKDVWTTYRVPISDDVFTRYGNSSVELIDMLESIRGVDVRGDLLEGIETTCIDNVKIYDDSIVGIDIKPGSFPNCFNLNSHGVIPVAILGSYYFDVLNIDIETLSFNGLNVQIRGKKDKTMCHLEDVSGDFSNQEGAPDGYLDLVCQFQDDPYQWVAGEAEAMLTGNLYDGTQISGTDSICIVP